MEPFATSDDLTDRYDTGFDEDSEAADRANVLLAAASRFVRQRVPGIDARTDLDFDLVTDVVCEMVWSAITAPAPGATSQSQSLGGVSVSLSFEGAAGRLRMTKDHLRMLRPPRLRARAGSTDNLPASAGVLRAPGAEWPYGYRPC